MSVLVVESDQALRDLVAEYLRTRGMEVRGVGTLDAAREALVAGEPSALLLSDSLPDGPWTDLLPVIRGCRRAPALLVASGNPTVEGAVAALKAGAEDYLVRPLKLRDLHATLARATRQVLHANARVEGVLRLASSFQEAPIAAARALLIEMTQVLVNEVGAQGALIAVREPALGRWVELHRTHSRVFTRLNLERVGQLVAQDQLRGPQTPELWHGAEGPHLHIVPLHLRLQPRLPARRAGALLLAVPSELNEVLNTTLRLYGAITEQALSTSALVTRAWREEQPGQAAELCERILGHVEPVMDVLMLTEAERAGCRLAAAALCQDPTPPPDAPAPVLAELDRALAAVLERHDGRGSPLGLSGRQIPPTASLLALGVWWALNTGGSALLPALRPEEVRAELEARAGRQFSPAVVAAFLRTLGPDLRSEDTIPPLGDDDDEDGETSHTPAPPLVWLNS